MLEQRANAKLLNEVAPTRVRLSSGRQAKIHYEAGKPPWVASRLQDFFGLRETPRIANGKVPLVVHLLAPNQRPVQTTTDLAGFWQRLYPAGAARAEPPLPEARLAREATKRPRCARRA